MGNNISRVTSHKFLGIMVDETLHFDVHIDKLCSKVSQSKCVICPVSNVGPDNVLQSLYYTLIFSRITYAISA